jgi:hypothetical protein
VPFQRQRDGTLLRPSIVTKGLFDLDDEEERKTQREGELLG